MARPLSLAAGVMGALAVAALLGLPWLGTGAQAAGVRLDSIEISVPHRGVVVVLDGATSGMIIAIDGLGEVEATP